jgi:phosphoribosylformylglycinamidine synthase
MKFKADVRIMPKKEILDPQGKAVLLGLGNLNINNVEDVRVGKHVEMVIDAENREKAEEEVEMACKKLLANVIMETYSFSLSEL